MPIWNKALYTALHSQARYFFHYEEEMTCFFILKKAVFILRQISSYQKKKVIKIGTVKELTGLSERQIRYYEEKKLIFPERTPLGTRQYSFFDIELLVEISKQIQRGFQTDLIRRRLNQKLVK